MKKPALISGVGKSDNKINDFNDFCRAITDLSFIPLVR